MMNKEKLKKCLSCANITLYKWNTMNEEIHVKLVSLTDLKMTKLMNICLSLLMLDKKGWNKTKFRIIVRNNVFWISWLFVVNGSFEFGQSFTCSLPCFLLLLRKFTWLEKKQREVVWCLAKPRCHSECFAVNSIFLCTWTRQDRNMPIAPDFLTQV